MTSDFFLAASREGSLSGAARVLNVDHVTVGRRIAALEERLGAKLLTRTPEGLDCQPSAGQAILRQCEAMETSAFDIERLVAGHDSQYGGRIRLTTTEVLATHVIVPELAALCERYPQLQVEILTGVRLLDIARREAEIAVRPVKAHGAKPGMPQARRIRLRAVCLTATTWRGTELLREDGGSGVTPHQLCRHARRRASARCS